jgi:hypothetical protein
MRFEICMEDGFILEILCKEGMKGVGSINQEKGEGRDVGNREEDRWVWVSVRKRRVGDS